MSSPPRAAATAGLPAWKRALLERKRAKLAGGVAASPAEPAEDEAQIKAEGGERLVVAESLGPLRENPFMRLEGERRRRRGRRAPLGPPWAPPPPADAHPAAVPPAPSLSRLLELYSAMPGIRTIRADNILIIESRPGEEEEEEEEEAAGRGGAPRSLRRPRFARAGPPVTEIRAAEVVIYEPSKEESLPPPCRAELEPEPGTVSRLLQKFGQHRAPAATRGKWRGGEVAPQLPESRSAVPNTPLQGAPAPAPLLPGASASSPPPARSALPHGPLPGGFVRKTGSNSFTVNPRGCRPAPLPGKEAPVHSNGPSEVAEADNPAATKAQGWHRTAAAPEPMPTATASPQFRANLWKPKPEGAIKIPPSPTLPSCASPGGGSADGPLRSSVLLGSGCSFEIHPAPKPDVAAIAAHDLQAQALASLRLNSRNSFLFVPRQKGNAMPAPPEPKEIPPAAPEKLAETLVPVTYIDEDLVDLEPGHLPPLKVLSPRLEGFDVPQEGILALDMEDATLPTYSPHPPRSAISAQDRSTTTFTIVPKRKPLSTGLETFSRAHLQEEEEEEEEESRTRTDVPHRDLGRQLKKRYPTANEIEVIGGYLSLDRSCMSKSGSRRKKLKISFNESSLQTMFEYPSESSLVEEEEEEEEEEYATEVDEPAALPIPRPNSLRHSNTTNSGFSRCIPKHSTGPSQWQEQQPEEMAAGPGAFPQEADLPDSQVMLTPADRSSLSDFSSEPALYF